jgi:trans-L-3-hydroxyproline dehydratase
MSTSQVPESRAAQRARVWRDWRPARGASVIRAIDAHTEGEPLRVILDGLPPIPGDTILERRRWAQQHLEPLRTALMWEPRGHADMYGCILMDPATPDGDFGVLFLHNEGWSTMCGHGIIGITTVVLETGLVPADRTTLRIDTPAGRITARATLRAGRVERVAFRNVPSFVADRDAVVDVPGMGAVRYDLAFGGAWYAYVDAPPLGIDLTPGNYRRIIDTGRAVKHAVMRQRTMPDTGDADLGFLYGTILVGPPLAAGAHSRNVCIFAEGEVDRSPTGTGVSGRVAIHYARGDIGIGQPIVVESIIGTRFTGRAHAEARSGPWPAVIPEVEGSAVITGRHEFTIDPGDPLAGGFILR